MATTQDCAGACIDRLPGWLSLGSDRKGSPSIAPGQYTNIESLVRASAPGAGGVMFLPWINGERTPVEDSNLRGGWVGLSLGTKSADLVRSVFEGVALNTRWMHRTVEKFVGAPQDDIRFIGGGALSDSWCQILADVLGRKILQVHEPRLSNVRGAALLGALALKRIEANAIPSLVTVAKTFSPDPERVAFYDRSYERFLGFWKNNKGWFAANASAKG